MGTGARPLGRSLVERGFSEVFVAMTHTHMDHIMGLPYFDPIYKPDFRVRFGLPAATEEEVVERVGRYLNGVFHPVFVNELGSNLSFFPIPSGAGFELGPYRIRTMRLVHPGGTLGYRIEVQGRSVCYLTDTGPMAQPGEGLMVGGPPTSMELALLDFCSGADVMIMDTTFDQDEYHKCLSWGHAYPEYAVAVGKLAKVEEVILFHHNPDASDDELDAMAEEWATHASPRVTLAKEGRIVSLEG